MQRCNSPVEGAEEDLSLGRLASCTPLPTNAKRRRVDVPDAPVRPFWGGEKGANSRIDAKATDKRHICKVYQRLNERAGRGKGGDTALPKQAAVPGEGERPDQGDRASTVRRVVRHSRPVLEGGAGRRRPIFSNAERDGEKSAEIEIRRYMNKWRFVIRRN